MYVQFNFYDLIENWNDVKLDYYSKVPTVEIYRYSDNALVTNLTVESANSDGLSSGIFTDFDESTMYLKFIAPSVRMTINLVNYGFTTCHPMRRKNKHFRYRGANETDIF